MSAETPIEIRRRLKARAAELGLDFQQAVLYYAMGKRSALSPATARFPSVGRTSSGGRLKTAEPAASWFGSYTIALRRDASLNQAALSFGVRF